MKEKIFWNDNYEKMKIGQLIFHLPAEKDQKNRKNKQENCFF